MGLKGAKIGDFGGRSLSSGFDSALQINPDSPEAHRLKGWWEQVGCNLTFQAFVSGSGGDRKDVIKTISDVTDEGLGLGDKARNEALTMIARFLFFSSNSGPRKGGKSFLSCLSI